MIRLFQVKCASENEIEAQILKKLRIRKEDLLQWHVHRKSVDARHQKVLFSYVVDCKVKNEKKLLKLKVDLGGEERQVVSGISKFYKPEDLIGKNVVLVANLKPVKLRGELSQGMILAASTDDDSILSVVNPGDLPTGSIVR